MIIRSPRSFAFPVFILGALLIASTARAEGRASLTGGSANGTTELKCPDGSYLVGLGQAVTDRLIGLRLVCGTPASNGDWSGSPTDGSRALGTTLPDPSFVQQVCTRFASFVVGLDYQVGSYTPDHLPLSATPAVQGLADLAPVCRGWTDGVRKTLDPPALTHSADNHVQAFHWDGVGGAKSCPEGQAAVGLSLGYHNEAFKDFFDDAALLCEKLWVNLPPAASPKTFVLPEEGTMGKDELATGKDRSGGRAKIRAHKGQKAFAPPYDDGQRYGFCGVAGNYATCRQAAGDAFCKKQGTFVRAVLFGPPEVAGSTLSATNPDDTCTGSCLALTTVLCGMSGPNP